MNKIIDMPSDGIEKVAFFNKQLTEKKHLRMHKKKYSSLFNYYKCNCLILNFFKKQFLLRFLKEQIKNNKCSYMVDYRISRNALIEGGKINKPVVNQYYNVM